MLSALLQILSSSGLGAIIGLLGSWVTKLEERKLQKLKFDYNIEIERIRQDEAKDEMEHEIKMADKEIDRAKAEAEIQKELGSSGIPISSILKDQRDLDSWTTKLSEMIRSVMRPIITLYLLIIVSFIAIKVNSYISVVNLDTKELLILYKDIVSNIMFLVTTAITWWFGSRNTNKFKR